MCQNFEFSKEFFTSLHIHFLNCGFLHRNSRDTNKYHIRENLRQTICQPAGEYIYGKKANIRNEIGAFSAE